MHRATNRMMSIINQLQPQNESELHNDSQQQQSAEQILASIQSQIAPHLKVRRLVAQDYDLGFLQLLAQLTTVGDVSKHQFNEQFERITSLSETYHIYVLHDSTLNRIVGCATLLIEEKFIHACSRIGHIEDVVVAESHRGQRLGLALTDLLTRLAQQVGCYKCILDCDESNMQFYARLGYKENSKHMAKYY